MTSNQINLGRLKEDQRHNRNEESLGWSTLKETSRHNVAQEGIGYGNISLGYATLGESQRHNIAQETENVRHNTATEGYQSEQASATAGKLTTDAAYTQLQIDHYLDELKVRQDNAEASLRQAATAEERARIEDELKEITKKRAFYQNLRDLGGAVDSAINAASTLAEAANPVQGLLK